LTRFSLEDGSDWYVECVGQPELQLGVKRSFFLRYLVPVRIQAKGDPHVRVLRDGTPHRLKVLFLQPKTTMTRGKLLKIVKRPTNKAVRYKSVLGRDIKLAQTGETVLMFPFWETVATTGKTQDVHFRQRESGPIVKVFISDRDSDEFAQKRGVLFERKTP